MVARGGKETVGPGMLRVDTAFQFDVGTQG